MNILHKLYKEVKKIEKDSEAFMCFLYFSSMKNLYTADLCYKDSSINFSKEHKTF